MKVHHIFWLVLGLAGALAPDGLGAPLTPETLYQKVLPSVMTLEVESQSGERFVGSAVLALADDVALTTWHVVADARSVWAVFADGQRVRVTGWVDRDSAPDVALLKLEHPVPGRQAVLSRKLEPVAARAFVIGAPKGYDFSISDGLISQIRKVDGLLQYQLSCPISPGSSGSPVLNQHGEVIGIAAWTKSDAQNVSFAIPIEEFTRLKVSQRAMSWEQLAATGPSARTNRLTRLLPTPDQAREAAAGDFAAWQQWLKDSTGKSVTVVAQEAGRTNIFKFTVE